MLLLISSVEVPILPNTTAVGAEHVKKHVQPLIACTRGEYEACLLTNLLFEVFNLHLLKSSLALETNSFRPE